MNEQDTADGYEVEDIACHHFCNSPRHAVLVFLLDVEHVVDGSQYVGAIKDQENSEQSAFLSSKRSCIFRSCLLPGQVDEYDDYGASQKGEVHDLHR